MGWDGWDGGWGMGGGEDGMGWDGLGWVMRWDGMGRRGCIGFGFGFGCGFGRVLLGSFISVGESAVDSGEFL